MYAKQSIKNLTMEKLLDLVYSSGLVRLGHPFLSRFLTVVNYHRIHDITPSFDSFRPNVSATTSMFEEQMKYLSRWFRVVSVEDIILWLHGKANLPPHAALITFDDGYLDNYTNAYPILLKYNLPAVIFLTTGHINTDEPFYWDLAAYCFFYTKKSKVLFPDKTEKHWNNEKERDFISNTWIESLKILPDIEKKKWVNELPIQLDIMPPKGYFQSLMMNWDQIREMSRNGIEFGGHTINHPILSRISLEQAHKEINGSKSQIEKEIGKSILSFAYPNGMNNDVNSDIENITANAGYEVAFTLINGPTSLREVKNNPFAIRRIFIGSNHSMAHFGVLTHLINRYRK